MEGLPQIASAVALGVAIHLFGVWTALGLGILCYLLCYVFQPFDVLKFRGIPGPRARPIVGHLPQVLSMGSMALYMQLKEKYGPIFKVWYGRRVFVVITDPGLARHVGVKLLNHPNFVNTSILRGPEREVEAAGLVVSRDEYWRTLRNTWQPAFSPGALSGYVPLMAAATDLLVERLHWLSAQGAPDDKKSVDMWRELGAMTLQVVGSTAYGVDFNAIEPTPNGKPRPMPSPSAPGPTLVEACKTFFRTSSIHTGSKWSRLSMLVPELAPLWARLAAWIPDTPLVQQRNARRTILSTSKALIDGWRQDHAAVNGSANGTDTSKPAVVGGSFLAQLLKERASSSTKLTDAQMAAQANTFTLAGYETTANGLAFTMYLLACNPEAKEKLVAEADALAEKLKSEGKPGLEGATMEDLAQLPYTEACFQESLRLYPPAHLTTRETTNKPFSVHVNAGAGKGMKPLTIPPRTTIVLSLNTIHHDPALWPEPEAFKPERFLVKQDGQQLNHVPFGYGSRMCIGYRFALAEAKLALARLYHDFDYTLDAGQMPLKVSVGITQAPKGGLHMKLIPRSRVNAQ